MQYRILSTAALFSFLFIIMGHLRSQSSVLTFRVDLGELEMTDGSTVGIRGSMPPLSWNRSYPMEDTTGDGIYVATIDFGASEAGERVFYKYIKDDVLWENDAYGSIGNRFVNLGGCERTLPVEEFDHPDEFAPEFLLENADGTNFTHWVYVIGSGKQRGLTANEAIVEFMDYWQDRRTWMRDTKMMATMAEIRQAGSMHGNFKLLEDEPGQVKYRERNIWLAYVNAWGEDGHWKGVTSDDARKAFKAYTEYITDQKGWTLEWEEDGMDVVCTVSTNN